MKRPQIIHVYDRVSWPLHDCIEFDCKWDFSLPVEYKTAEVILAKSRDNGTDVAVIMRDFTAALGTLNLDPVSGAPPGTVMLKRFDVARIADDKRIMPTSVEEWEVKIELERRRLGFHYKMIQKT